jgi:hypothetical protein
VLYFQQLTAIRANSRTRGLTIGVGQGIFTRRELRRIVRRFRAQIADGAQVEALCKRTARKNQEIRHFAGENRSEKIRERKGM